MNAIDIAEAKKRKERIDADRKANNAQVLTNNRMYSTKKPEPAPKKRHLTLVKNEVSNG